MNLAQKLLINNDTETLVKANTDDFNKIQWKTEEPPWQTPDESRRPHAETAIRNDGVGRAPANSMIDEDVAQKPNCGLTTKIFSTCLRLVSIAVHFMKNIPTNIHI